MKAMQAIDTFDPKDPLDPRNPANDSYSLSFKIRKQKEFFHRTVSCFTEEDAGYQPREDMLSVVGQIYHIAGANELMISGVLHEIDRFKGVKYVSLRPGATWIPWSMEWAKSTIDEANTVEEEKPEFVSLKRALQVWDGTMDIADEVFGSLTQEELFRPFKPNPMRIISAQKAFEAMIDHTVHHRGGLAQYARFCGRDPKIPYYEMSEVLHEAQLLGYRT
jgi:hypothetical protein